MAKQAHGSALVRYGDSMVLVAACRDKARPGIDFFPLTVDYREKTSAAGKFPGGFIKREGRPSTKEILTMRLIDRSIRPLFPKGYNDEVQVMAGVLSVDDDNEPDVMAMVGAYAALAISDIPFEKNLGAVRVGRIDNEFVVNPLFSTQEDSDLNLTVAGSDDSILMVEAGADEITEDDMIAALECGHDAIKQIVEMVDELVEKAGKEKIDFEAPEVNEKLIKAIRKDALKAIEEATSKDTKEERYAAIDEIKAEMVEKHADDEDDSKPSSGEVKAVVDDLKSEVVRKRIVDEGKRADGRDTTTVRPITIETGLLPRVHGSALFTRGETQALVMLTLGTTSDDQVVEGLMEEYRQKFMLHYNFPPFSVGECRMIRGPGRREIGHGALAQRALEPVLPEDTDFPYTIRLISDVLESNGSSSMASVCGGTLAMMDAGVPILRPVAGIAMGLVLEGDKEVILTDILGSEDHLGDMDFKVSGTQQGITALQMDIKVSGVSKELMSRALEQAREGRIHILREMLKALSAPREQLSEYAPRLIMVKIDPDKIGMVIGPGGKMIRSLQERTETQIDIEDDGTVTISSTGGGKAEECAEIIRAMTGEIEVGQVYTGKVVGLKDFGAFVELVPGRDGMVHISELSNEYVKNIHEHVKMGDEMTVKVIGIDDQDRVKLSRKALLKDEEGGDDKE